MTDDIEYLRYVRRERVPAYLALGWAVEPVSVFVHHDAHVFLMRWAGEGAPVEPAAAKLETCHE